MVMTQWAWSYFTYQRSVRLVTDFPDERERHPPETKERDVGR